MQTGNCMNGRHHTCKGGGVFRARIEGQPVGKLQRYICDCPCHKNALPKDESYHPTSSVVETARSATPSVTVSTETPIYRDAVVETYR